MGAVLLLKQMNKALCILIFCLFALVNCYFDPNGVQIKDSSVVKGVHSRGDDEICGTGQLYYTWGSHKTEDGHGSPRFSELYFYYNGSFHDNTYNYLGTWIEFGSHGDNIFIFRYVCTLLFPFQQCNRVYVFSPRYVRFL